MFYNGIDGYSIKIAKKDYKTNLLQNLMIYNHSDNKENVEVTIADSGYMRMTADEKNLILTLYNGCSFEEVKESKQNRRRRDRIYPHKRQEFEKQTVIFELADLNFSRTDEDLFKNNFKMLNLRQLEYAEDSLIKQYKGQILKFKENTIRSNYFKKENILIRDIESKSKLKIRDVESKSKLNRNYRREKLLRDSDLRDSLNTRTHKFISDSSILLQKVSDKTTKNDSVNKNEYIINLDSIFYAQKRSDKESILEYALTYARAAQNNINSSKKQFNRKAERIRRHQIEWHRKFALSFACMVFFFIGAPFGAIIRKGGFGTPVVVSILFFILYYMISIAGEKFAREGVIPPYIGMWLSSFILMPLGIFLTYKATTDSVILNADTYLLFFKKIFIRFYKRFK